MKKVVKIALAAVVALACVAAGVAVAMQPLEVELQLMEPRTARVTFTEQGSYDYSSTFQVYPLIAGEVLEVLVGEGDTVEAGDVLAVVSASDLEYEIRQLQSTISGYNAQIGNLELQEEQEKDALRGTLEDLQGQLAALEAQIENEDPLWESQHEQARLQQSIVRQYRKMVEELEDELDYMEDLYQSGDISYVEYSAYQQQLAAAKSSYYGAQVTLEQLRNGGTPEGILEGQRQSLEAQIASVSDRLDKSYTGAMGQYYSAQIQGTNAIIDQLQERAGQAFITSPVAGVVRALPIQDQNVITQQSPVADIGSEALVEVFISTRELDGVGAGDSVELLLDKRMGTESVPGLVVLVEDKAQVKYSALGVEERKVRVLVQPLEPGPIIGQEMDVQFTVYTQENALIVSKTAVFPVEGADCVWVVRDGAAQIQPITKGAETREGFVAEGLAPGDLVVVDANNDQLSQGKKIKVEQPQQEAGEEQDASSPAPASGALGTEDREEGIKDFQSAPEELETAENGQGFSDIEAEE